jgi:pimeloyl-ACP methyl ester carboxylesterase
MTLTLRYATLVCFLLLLAPLSTRAQESDVVQAEDPDFSSPQTVRKVTTVYGAKIHYLEAGTGPTIVLLHGLGGNSGDFTMNVTSLARKFRVVVPDQLGFGRSDKPLIEYRIGTYVDFLDRFLSSLKIERASLVGNSLGGWIAASYTLAHPSRVERLVLIDAAGFALPAGFDTKQLNGLNPSTRDGIKQLIERAFYNSAFFGSDAFVDAALSQRINSGDGFTIKSVINLIARREESIDDRLGAIKQPTLIIWGRQDGIVPLADGERFQREIPGSRLVVFDRCGHLPQVEKPLDFNNAVMGFLVAPRG